MNYIATCYTNIGTMQIKRYNLDGIYLAQHRKEHIYMKYLDESHYGTLFITRITFIRYTKILSIVRTSCVQLADMISLYKHQFVRQCHTYEINKIGRAHV